VDAANNRKASSVDEFCIAHGISRAMFYKLLKVGKGPRVMRVGSRTLVSEESAAAWRRAMEAEAEKAAA
jgi:predicted DNA-binding transcriptional regulator AlpA